MKAKRERKALEKAEARLASAIDAGRNMPAPLKKIGPVGDSGRIAAAKAEVIRLVEQNKKKAAEADETAPAPVETVQETPEPKPPSEESVPVAEEPAPLAEEAAPLSEEPAPVAEEATPLLEEPAPEKAEPVAAPVDSHPTPEKKQPAHGDLFALD